MDFLISVKKSGVSLIIALLKVICPFKTIFLVDLWRRECWVYSLIKGVDTSLQDVGPLSSP